MIAVDTSTWIAFFDGDEGRDVELLDAALARGSVVVPVVVLVELLSDPSMPEQVAARFRALPRIGLGYESWERAAKLRAAVLARGRKARIADTLIAQCCLDHGASLVTRDRDFRHFRDLAGLELLVQPGS